MAIGLYGGTFDPIHHGHLILARDALERLGLERVVFIPAAISPHKLDREPSPAPVRRAMVAAAIAGEERFALDDRELHRAGPSFTVDTVEEIRARRRADDFTCSARIISARCTPGTGSRNCARWCISSSSTRGEPGPEARHAAAAARYFRPRRCARSLRAGLPSVIWFLNPSAPSLNTTVSTSPPPSS